MEIDYKPRGIPTQGPQRFRYITAGQARRVQKRDRRRQIAKNNRDQRRAFFKAQWDLSVLRAQLEVADKDTNLGRHCRQHLEARYGGLAEAQQHYTQAMSLSR